MNKTKRLIENRFKETEIGLIPTDWDVVRLEEVSEKLKAGGTPRTNIKEYWNGDISLVKVEDIASSEKYLTKTLSSITREGLESSSAWLVPKDSVLLSMYGTAGEVVINKIPVAVTQNILGIIKNDKITTEFLYYALIFSKNYGMSKITDKTIFKYFTLAKAKGLLFSLPPLPEQQKIASVLSKIQQAITRQDQIIAKTKELKRSLMHRLFTQGLRGEELKETEIGLMPRSWEVIELGDICDQRKDSVIPNGKGECIYVGLEHLVSGEIGINSYGYDNEVKSSKFRFDNQDVLYGKLRPYLDKAALPYFSGVCSTDIIVLTPNSKTIRNFLVYILHLQTFIDYAKATTSGTNHPRTSWSSLKKYKLALPKLEEQKEIANILSNVDQKIQQAEFRKQTLHSLFKTMLNNLMTGRVRVKDIDFGEFNV